MTRQEIIDEINSFKEIESNWDGYGAISPLQEVIVNCKSVIANLTDDKVSIIEDVFPNPTGTITFEFKTYKGDLHMEVGRTSMGYFIEIDGKDVECRDELSLNSPNSTATTMRIFNQDYKKIKPITSESVTETTTVDNPIIGEIYMIHYMNWEEVVYLGEMNGMDRIRSKNPDGEPFCVNKGRLKINLIEK